VNYIASNRQTGASNLYNETQGSPAPEDQNMNSTPSIKILAMCGILLSGFWATSAAGATGSFHQTLAVDGPLLLDVSTGSGSIEISSGSSQSVEVTGHIKVGGRSFFGLFGSSTSERQELVDRLESEPPISLVDGRLTVGHLKKLAFQSSVSISYEIVVPAGTEVVSHTGSGAQTISELAGPVEVKTGSGRITLTDIEGPVKARTGSGAIQADKIAGAFEAHTGSGRIEIDGQQQGDWNIDTGSGSVRIRLPEDAAFNLDAHTGSGGITVDHPLTVQGKTSRKHIRGEVRGGGDLLTVETGSGGIRIE
jgi:hypothetical protein